MHEPGTDDATSPGLSSQRSIFETDWIVLADAGGQVPPLTAFAHVAKAARDVVLANWSGPVPEDISGHAQDDSPTRRPHLAFLPLAFAGTARADGRLMGIAAVLPRGGHAPEGCAARAELKARLKAALASPENQPIVLTFGKRGVWCLEKREPPYGSSLDPVRYAGPARLWASVTPVILDRFPKPDYSEEEIISEACRDIGLPPPARVQRSRQSEILGVPPSGSPTEPWNDRAGGGRGWSLPLRRDGSAHPFENRLSTHIAVRFAEPVMGPIVLGAGRFLGLGLCLPVDNSA